MTASSKGRRFLLASAVTAGLWVVSALAIIIVLRWIPPQVPEPHRLEDVPSEVGPWVMIPDRIRRDEALASVLHRNGFSAREIHDVAQALGEQVNLRHLQQGDEVEIHFERGGDVQSVRIHRGVLETYEAQRSKEGWEGCRVDVHVERREVVRHGSLRYGGSLYMSMEAMGETPELTVAFAEVFQWDFDFYTQSRAGDRFSVVVEKLYRNKKFAGYGDLKAARYISGETDLAAFLYQDPTEKRDYYDREGKSMRKAFLRAPLKFRRISSGFSYSRLHPVHKKRMPHLGVDYAAPTGTPVHSIATGTVTGISRRGAGGNQVTIRHAMGYVSKYLHLSKFAGGLRVGKRVQQKEIIGRVGMTGTATGPHLDFRLYRHGKVVNPLKQIYPPGPPVPREYMASFSNLKEELEPKLLAKGRTRLAE